MSKKEQYSTPAVDVLVLQTEGVICQSNLGDPGSPGASWTDPSTLIEYTGIL